MKFALAALALTAVAAFARADGDVDESDVVVATKDNFDETVNGNEFVLVEFYAPWCGHCKRLIPEYAKAATAIKGEVVLAKVDATVESDLAQKYGVKGYPTLKFFRSGEATEYNGPRDADGIVAWLKKKSGPVSKALDAAADVDAFVADSKPAVVGAFAGARDSDAYKAFIDTAKSGDLDDFAFADVAGADADSITLYAAHLDAPLVYDAANDGADVKAWILKAGYPLVDELPAAWERYSKRGLPLAILFVDKSADNAAVLKEASAAAERVADKLAISFADGVRFKQQIERMGAPTDSLPVLAAMKLSGKANYPYAGELNADAIVAWAEGIADGSIQAHLRSEPVPESQDGPVTVVVGKSFKDVVLDADKDVLLEIYAPWCGHCKALVPTWDKLGEAYKGNDGVVIAKLDGTANDIEDVEFRGFPTIKFFPAGSSSAADQVDYDGGREYDDFVAFLKKSAKNAKGGEPAEADAAAAPADDAADDAAKKDEL
eukprot:CAMPEP_0198309808 /NCGR_PEP_ID=MMETSP1450-20131203/2066_1 /TAXON_ID=753684 ORGANISM="Madagascaria erythrocladiodes, Strain CCMP3234" /NCGR_SAMPLE_ID=MMETSP1450 /ASSEMBLY_ACC=CAM_ASM_001115 /LENGTH=490 /DNA_ID=CAMNT_0044012587 /DNA_START=71 /DNA_END=1543 /DNA_ORIENTATION=+